MAVTFRDTDREITKDRLLLFIGKGHPLEGDLPLERVATDHDVALFPEGGFHVQDLLDPAKGNPGLLHGQEALHQALERTEEPSLVGGEGHETAYGQRAVDHQVAAVSEDHDGVHNRV
jgi:hypothetical protein